MGKDSLIKSTAAKSGSKKKKASTKKTAAKKAAPVKPKKGATAQGAKAAPIEAAKPTIKDLLFKKFESRNPPVVDPPPAPDRSRMTAPLFIDSEDPAEIARLRDLLGRRFSMDDIRAAAKPPMEEKSAPVADEPPPDEAPAAAATPEPAGPPAVESPDPGQPQPPVETMAEDILKPEAEAVPEAEPEQTIETEPTPEPVPEADPTPQPVAATEPPTERVTAPEPPRAIEPQPTYETTPPPVPPSAEGPTQDPVMRAMYIGIATLGVLVVLILWASFSNSSKYYLEARRDGVMVQRGTFSPTGKQVVTVLPGMELDTPAQSVYHRKEVFPMIHGHYLAKADAMLAAAGLPDFPAVRDTLDTARSFAIDREMGAAVTARLNNLQRTELIHKAHVEISKDTITSLDAALQALLQARRLAEEGAQLEAVNQMITIVNERKAYLQEAVGGESPAAG